MYSPLATVTQEVPEPAIIVISPLNSIIPALVPLNN